MLNKLVRTLTAPLLAAVLGSCATYSSYQTVPMPDQSVELEQPAKSRLYVIRADQVVWQRAPLLIYDGEELLGKLRPGSYISWERNPGRFLGRLLLDRPDVEGDVEQMYDVQLEAGDVRYVKVTFNNGPDLLVAERLDTEAGRALVASSKAAAER